jgi:hypothetical protein
MINGGPITRRTNRPLISWRLACPVCGVSVMEPRCPHDESFVADVEAADVLEQCFGLLGQESESQEATEGRSEQRLD